MNNTHNFRIHEIYSLYFALILLMYVNVTIIKGQCINRISIKKNATICCMKQFAIYFFNQSNIFFAISILNIYY